MRFIVGVLVAIGLVILVIVLIFSGGGSNTQREKPLLSRYANTDTVMRMTIEGSVVAPQKYQEIQTTVGRDQSTLKILQGYQGKVIKSKSYDNNVDSYSTFLHALDRAGYTKGSNDSQLKDDRGVCPLGNRFVFEIISGSTVNQRYWTTNCGGGGSFNGNTNLVITLFQRQIPDYNDLTSDVNL